MLDDVMMEQNDPGVMGMILEDQLQRPELRRIDDADGVGEREVTAGIRIEENDPISLICPRGFDQWKDRVPNLRHLPSSAHRAALRQRAQPLGALAFAQVFPKRWAERAGCAVDHVRPPWMVSSASTTRSLRSDWPGLQGRSKRAGLVRSMIFTSWLPGTNDRRARNAGNLGAGRGTPPIRRASRHR